MPERLSIVVGLVLLVAAAFAAAGRVGFAVAAGVVGVLAVGFGLIEVGKHGRS